MTQQELMLEGAQLELKLSGFDVEKCIAYFSNSKLQLRWYREEVASTLSRLVPKDQGLIDLFAKSRDHLFYRDEIVEMLKQY